MRQKILFLFLLSFINSCVNSPDTTILIEEQINSLHQNTDCDVVKSLAILDSLIQEPTFQEKEDNGRYTKIIERFKLEKYKFDKFEEGENLYEKLFPIVEYIQENQEDPDIKIQKIKDKYVSFLNQSFEDLNTLRPSESDNYVEASRKTKRIIKYTGDDGGMGMSGPGIMRFGVLGGSDVYRIISAKKINIEFPENNISGMIEKVVNIRNDIFSDIVNKYDDYVFEVESNLISKEGELLRNRRYLLEQENKAKQALYKSKQGLFDSHRYYIEEEDFNDCKTNIIPSFKDFKIKPFPSFEDEEPTEWEKTLIKQLENNSKLSEWEKGMQAIALFPRKLKPIANGKHITSIRPLNCVLTDRSKSKVSASIACFDIFTIDTYTGKISNHHSFFASSKEDLDELNILGNEEKGDQ